MRWGPSWSQLPAIDASGFPAQSYATAALLRSVLEPRILGSQLGMDPLATLIAMYCGYRLWGLAGMLLLPMLSAAAVQMFREER